MKRISIWLLVVIGGIAPAVSSGVLASDGDWPMWRHDAGRTGASSLEVPGALRLQWKHQLPRPMPTFPNDLRQCFDKSYEPVAMGKRLFVPSMVTDSVTAFDTATGQELWRFFAEGPVRFAPVAWQDKVAFVSDDGFLYCVSADDGRLLWKFSPMEPERRAYKLLGDERLISRWPARGGPVMADETIYFAAGIWPFEGVAVCAVDAATGQARWVNKDCAFIKDGELDHGSRFDGGVSPQGYLAVLGSKLIVPCGRALPAFFDRATGRMDPYTSGWGGRVALAKGCWYACGTGNWLFQSGDLYQMRASAPQTGSPPKPDEYMRVQEFAQQMKVSAVTMDKWIKQFKLDVVTRDGERWLRVRNGDDVTYLSWWTSRKNAPPRPGEQHVLETRTRVQIDPANSKELGVFREPVFTDGAMYYSMPVSDPLRNLRNSNEDRKLPRTASYTEIVACDLASQPQWQVKLQGGWGEPNKLVAWAGARFNQLWSLPSSLKVHIKAGRRLYTGGPSTVAAVEIPVEGQPAKVSWQASITGTPSRMLVADGKLFVITIEGNLYCFGAGKAPPKNSPVAANHPASPKDSWAARAADILRQTGVRDGYGIALGVGSGRLVEELTQQSKLRMIVLEPDAAKVAAARREFFRLGLYGTRVHVLTGDLSTLRLAPYLASLVVAEELTEADVSGGTPFATRLLALLRPYGGCACFALTSGVRDALAQKIQTASLAGAEWMTRAEWSLVTRRGALPGAADWAHASGDAAHTFASMDGRVAGPLGVLWFGGELDRTVPWIEGDPPRLPGEAEPSPYAGGGPPPRVAGGRMFVQIGDDLFASDIYTGRHLWKKNVKTLGDFAVTEDSVYAIGAGNCLCLNAATGEQRASFACAVSGGWRELRVRGDFVVGATGKLLVCVDRHSGAVRWKQTAQRDGFNFAVAADRVFCIDHWWSARRRGEAKTEDAEIVALKLAGGELLWRAQTTVPPPPPSKRKDFAPPLKPQLSFSEQGNVLFFTRNRATAEAYRGTDGHLLWSKELPCKDPPNAFTSYHPPIVLADRLIAHGGKVYDLATGEPLGGRLWKELRGCGRALGCQRLILLRDAYASYLDLTTGVHSYFRGIRAGCTNNLIAADGILSAPHYARHCNCNYPISFSAAFATIPEAATWDPAPAETTRSTVKGSSR